jgi:hypothetical protein
LGNCQKNEFEFRVHACFWMANARGTGDAVAQSASD